LLLILCASASRCIAHLTKVLLLLLSRFAVLTRFCSGSTTGCLLGNGACCWRGHDYLLAVLYVVVGKNFWGGQGQETSILLNYMTFMTIVLWFLEDCRHFFGGMAR